MYKTFLQKYLLLTKYEQYNQSTIGSPGLSKGDFPNTDRDQLLVRLVASHRTVQVLKAAEEDGQESGRRQNQDTHVGRLHPGYSPNQNPLHSDGHLNRLLRRIVPGKCGPGLRVGRGLFRVRLLRRHAVRVHVPVVQTAVHLQAAFHAAHGHQDDKISQQDGAVDNVRGRSGALRAVRVAA